MSPDVTRRGVWDGGPVTARTSRRVRDTPLTADLVIDAALELTRERGLDGWTLRELAAALKTWPNTIDYHVGDREAVVAGVVNRVVAMMDNPAESLSWQDWFRTLLFKGREVLARYPGVARRLSRDGATVPAALPVMDRGVGLLVAAGFGPDAPLAYAALLNSATLLVALDDDRAAAGRADSQPAQELLDMEPPTGPGWVVMRSWLQDWSVDPELNRQHLYRYIVETIIAGLQARISPAATVRGTIG